jgi:colanic acid/amylovoran biosynthesis protein
MVVARRLKLGLLWHSLNSGNLGLGALTVSNIALAREAAARVGAEPEFVIIGARDSGTALHLPGVDYLPVTRRSLFTSREVYNRIRALDAVLDIGGGDSFADIYGAKRFAFLWTTKAMAIQAGVPLVLSPQTIGPFKSKPIRAMASWAMERAWLTVARDPLSFRFLEEIAPGARRLLSADVAFRLPFERRAKAEDGRRHIGLNVSGLIWNEADKGTNRFGLGYDYAAFTRALLDRFTTDRGVQVHLITHVVSKSAGIDDDGPVADRLAGLYPNAIRVPDFGDPSAVKSYISGLDLMISARMHACIAAFSSGVPVIPVAYSRKFSGLFEGVLRYPHTLPLTTAAPLAFVEERLDRLDELRADIAAGLDQVEPLLARYVDALAELFSGLPR